MKKIDILKPKQIKEFIEYLDYELESEVSRKLFKYINQGFSEVDKYADPKFNDNQMAQIRYGLEKGIDVTKYADPKFNWKQMLIIREGLEQGLNVSAYANPDINWTKMEQIMEEIKEKSKQRINWHKITRRIPTEEEKEVYNYKNNDTMLEGLPNYDEEILVTNGECVWVDSFDEDENGVYLSGTGYEADDVLAWAEIKIPNFNSLAESGAGGATE